MPVNPNRRPIKDVFKQAVVSMVLPEVPRWLFEKLSPSKLIVPYYHVVSDSRIAHVCNLYPYKGTRDFASDLDHLLMHFEPVALADVRKAVETGRAFERPSFHLTFDDGFRELHDVVAPILRRKGVPATFFINSAYTDNKAISYEHKASILLESATDRDRRGLAATLSAPFENKAMVDGAAERMGLNFEDYLARQRPYLDSAQIRDLIREGFTIGSHGIDHEPYASACFEERVRQTVESTRWVRERFGLGYGAFAFPHSDRCADGRLFAAIRASGLVDLSFGNRGIANRELAWHIQRFSLEKPLLPADRVIAWHCARTFWRSRSAAPAGST